MKKLINVFIVIVMFILYLPLMPVGVFSLVCQVIRASREHKKIVDVYSLCGMSLFWLTLGAESYKHGEYDIYILRDHSLCLTAGVFIDILNKRILVGYELADEFKNNSNLGEAILLHEKGHVEAKYGNTTKKLWWNPEDWLCQGGSIKSSVLREIAADRWALENGGDGEALIKFMKHHIGQCPISILLRIHNIRKYMKAHHK